jgi:hypothetical protein
LRAMNTAKWSLMVVLGELVGVTQAAGQETWLRTYGGYGIDEGNHAIQLSDGTYAVCGSTGSFGAGSSDVYLLILDALGELLWSRTYGGAGVDHGVELIELGDGGFMIGATTNSFGQGGFDAMLIRTLANGDTLWTRTYGGLDWDIVRGIDAVGDSIYLTGQTYSTSGGPGGIWLVKIDNSGNTIWEQAVGGANSDEGSDVHSTADGGFILAATSKIGAEDDACLMKFDGGGSLQWEYCTNGDSAETAYSCAELVDGYVMVASTTSYWPFSTYLITKVDQDGALLWDEVGYESDVHELHSVVEGSNGRLVFSGFTKAFGLGNEEAYFLLANELGQFIEGSTYGTTEADLANSIEKCSDGGFIMAGSTSGVGPGFKSVFVLKTDSLGHTTIPIIQEGFDPLSVSGETQKPNAALVYPNPLQNGNWLSVDKSVATSSVVRISTPTGRLVQEFKVLEGGRSVQCRLPTAGYYILAVHSINAPTRYCPLIVH